MTKKDVLQPVDADVRRSAKTFLRTARHAALATIDPASGIPMASRISVASDSRGCPLFLISQLSGHFGALESDPRASVLLGDPGRGDPLAHPRITVFGHARQVSDNSRTRLRARFLARHPKAELYVDLADFAFWRLEIEGASFNGGFGKAYQLTGEDLLAPTDPDLEEMEAGVVAHMNEDHRDAIALYAQQGADHTEGPWTLACVDLEGLDLTSSDRAARVWFDPPLATAEELRPRLVAMAKRARAVTSN
ncbi:DUF2470 domain-containing protein [uncultured Roseobacter sp.]|uniref:HugZ family pyridoxamine 5'-phosphate oxidase n=1 Tax=uncultured Roseobacter sp. TaxID=114847 RepID=UPI002618EB56|nr:DUF2470 domain-containing protein [uncultured Roseobacter sp.]